MCMVAEVAICEGTEYHQVGWRLITCSGRMLLAGAVLPLQTQRTFATIRRRHCSRIARRQCSRWWLTATKREVLLVLNLLATADPAHVCIHR